MISTSHYQDKAFINDLFPSNLLEQAMQFIANNFEPEDIFGNERMDKWAVQWADANGYIEEEEV
jgi:hypothetical protein